MSNDFVFLIRVPSSVLAGDEYVEVDDFWKGPDYLVDASGDRYDASLETHRKSKHALAVKLTRQHLRALSAAPRPREILVTSIVGVPEDRPATYVELRKIWLASGAYALPDVVDEVLASKRSASALPRLMPDDIRIALPPGTVRARLRKLDAEFAIEQLHGHALPSEVAEVRAAVVLVDVDHDDRDALTKHYREALRALGMSPKAEEPSEWTEELFSIQMRGRVGNVEVSVTGRPTATGGTEVGVLWIERVIERAEKKTPPTKPRAKAKVTSKPNPNPKPKPKQKSAAKRKRTAKGERRSTAR